MGKDNIRFRELADSGKLAEELAAYIEKRLSEAISKRGTASLVVSGGTTPVRLFEELSTRELPWEKVHITLADERWVEPHQNEALVHRHLLKNRAAAARFVGLKTPHATASEGEKGCAERLKAVPRPFDILILGMGGDGHTASLFPGAAKLPEATAMDSGRTCMGIAPITAPHERMTLTLPVLLDSKEIIIHITGEGKRAVLEKAAGDGPETEMPIRYILRQTKVPVTVWWAP
jgi:6-phosphogluconolactonase